MSRKQVKWQETTVKESVRLLDTDPISGLSCKSARARTKKEGASVGLGPQIGHWLKRFASAPLFLILTIASVLALFFGEQKEGGSILVFLAFFAIFASKVLFSILQTNWLTDFYKMPMARVVREGKCGFMLSAGLVPGDVLLLRSGDVVPCQCRLLASKNLTVSMGVTGENGKKESKILSKKAETIYPVGDNTNDFDCENLLAKGEIILSGMARAVAVEAGPQSFQSPFQKESDTRFPNALSGYGNYLRYAEILSLVLILLHTVIGILVLPNDVGILRIFLPICSLTLAGSSILPTMFLYAFFASAKRRFLRKKNRENRCIFQSLEMIELFPSITDLVLLGNEAISDGILHCHSAWMGGKYYSFKELETLRKTPLAGTVGDALHYFDLATKKTHSANGVLNGHYRIFTEEFLKKIAFDKEASDLRLKNVNFAKDSNEIIETQLQEGNVGYAFLTEDPLSVTNLYLNDNAEFVELDKAAYKRFSSLREEAIQKGFKIVSAFCEKKETVALLGMFLLREDPIKNLEEQMKALEKEGVRVTAFLNSNDGFQTPFAAFDSINAPISNMDLILSDSGLEESTENGRIYKDIPRESILEWVKSLKRAGYRVAVVGNSVKDDEILNLAELRVACDGGYYHMPWMKEGIVEHFPETTFSGGSRAPDVLRQKADLLIPRGSSVGGGLKSVQQGMEICKEITGKILYLVPMLAGCLIFRLLVLLGCLVSGIGLPHGFWFLWCGIALDCALYAMISPAGSMKNSERNAIPFSYEDIFRNPTFWLRPIAAALTLILLVRFSMSMGWISTAESMTLIVGLLIPMQVFMLPYVVQGARPAFWRVLLAFLIPFLPLLGVFLLANYSSLFSNFVELPAWSRTMCLIPAVTMVSAGLLNLPLYLLERMKRK